MSDTTPSFEAVFEECKDSVYRLAYGLTGNADDAAEISQDTFTKVFRHLSSFRGQSKVATWVYEITRTTAISHLRKRKVRNMNSLTDHNVADRQESGTPEAANRLLQEESRRHLRDIVLSLPAEQQTVVTMFYFQELAMREMSRLLGWTESKIKTLLFRARKDLHQKLQMDSQH